MNKYWVLFLACSLNAGMTWSQEKKVKFRSPLNIPLVLAGNYGECRPNHFHTGLDFKTQSRENLPVYAVEDGYVSRIAVSATGYGNAVYLIHPNGYVTVYAHLNKFSPEVETYLKTKQYELEQWAVNLFPNKDEFSVKKGDIIAYSGNTGGSTAPHLHFEIRDAVTEEVLNAGLFDFNYTDNISPQPLSIAVYENKSIAQQTPKLISLKKASANRYKSVEEVVQLSSNTVKFGIRVNDFMNGSANTLGVHYAAIYVNDSLQCAWQLDRLSFSKNRYVNAFVDDRLNEQKKGWYQLLFKQPGNELDVYTYLNDALGAVHLQEGVTTDIKIVLKDVRGNESQVLMKAKANAGAAKTSAECENIWTYNEANEIKTADFNVNLPQGALYDDICFKFTQTANAKGLSPVINLFNPLFSLHKPFNLQIKLQQPIPFEWRSKLIFVHPLTESALPGKSAQNAVPAKFKNGFAEAAVQNWGKYYVALDTIPPVMTLRSKPETVKQNDVISIQVSDKETKVSSFRAELNGKWICFSQRGNVYTYKVDEKCLKGKNELKIMATDQCENTREVKYQFSRL